MRTAIANWSLRQEGGAETYLNSLIASLINQGHQVAFFHEMNASTACEPITLPDNVPVWSVARLGASRALINLRAWKPDVIYVHGLIDPTIESALVEMHNAIFFAHTYYGTCVSGAKCFQFPYPSPCAQRMGWRCLFNYLPHRCGGWNPVTMFQLYALQTRRLKNLSRYALILTHSAHMAEEYRRHLPKTQVRQISYIANESHPLPPVCKPKSLNSPLTLLFLGKMDNLKGGHILIESLPLVQRQLERPLHLIMAGNGPDRNEWELQAKQIASNPDKIQVKFTGEITDADKPALFERVHLHVMPSVWPEPFGMTGVEAGRYGVPSVAFDVGGISDWLKNGVNGFMARANSLSPESLADAMVKSLKDQESYDRLCRGSYSVASRYTMKQHLSELIPIFEAAMLNARTK